MQTLHTTSADGTRLRLGRWGSGGRNLLLVHGLAEHAGRYGHVADALAKRGWNVTFVELRGHGESGGKKGHVDSWIQYVEDLQAAAKAASPDGSPLTIVAHSMGGLVTLSALRRPLGVPVKALALSNPLLGVGVKAPAIKIKAAKLLSRLLPRLPLSNELDVKMISRDPDVVARYQADPLVYSTVTPRWYTQMIGAQADVSANAAVYTVPLRMMLGDADGICDHKAALEIAGRWGGPAEKVVYPGLYHELFNEPEKERVLAELADWLERA